MGRGKLKMELIADEKSRKITFQKRKRGMSKKCYEFSVLYGIVICMIIYGPKQIEWPTELVIYPDDSTQVARIIKQLQTTTIYKPPKRIFNLSDIFIDRKRKIDTEITKLRKVYFATKYPISDELINSLSRDQLNFLLSRLDTKIEDAKAMIDLHKENHLLLMKNPVGQNCANHVQNIFHEQKPAIPLNHHHHHPVVDHMQLPLQVLLNQTTPPPQMVPPPCFDSNPNPAINIAMKNPLTMMMLMNDQAGLENGASSSNIIDNHQFISSSSNNHLCGPVFNDPTLGMIDNMMFSNMGGQYSQLVQVQQPMPYIQYNQTVNAAAGIHSQRIYGSDEGNRFDDEFSEFLYKNKIL